jgi:hypothetical protein
MKRRMSAVSSMVAGTILIVGESSGTREYPGAGRECQQRVARGGDCGYVPL